MPKTTVKPAHGGGKGRNGKGKKAANAAPLNKIPIYVQPNFDDRIRQSLSAPFLDSSVGHFGIRRGYMVWDDTIPPPQGYDKKDNNYPAVFRFLFNPSTISTSYQIANGSAQAAMNYGTVQGLDQSLLLPMQQQTSFTIMFDRTYELNDPTSRREIQDFGVDVDIAALRQYTGMYAGVYSVNGSSNANFFDFGSSNLQNTTSGTARTNPNQSGKGTNVAPLGTLSQGIMQLTIGYVYFSGPTSNAVGGNGYGITYYGYIDSWSVEYTHFTPNMIPMRAVVDISFTFLPPPVKQPDSAGAAKIAAAQTVVTDALKVVGGLGNIGKGLGL